MPTRKVRSVLHYQLRSNPDYDIVEFERMNQAERLALEELREDPDCFGILRPSAESGLTVKSVCKETALLFYALREPGPVPSYLHAQLSRSGDIGNQQIAELILDGVLEIATDDGFVSGAEAHDLLYEQAEGVESGGRLVELSLEAVRFGQRLPIEEPVRLSAQMYFFNRSPVTPRWKRRIHDEASYREFAGIGPGGACCELLERHWDQAPDDSGQFGWKAWFRKSGDRVRRQSRGFKIYVSPTLESIPAVLPTVIRVFTEARVHRFKVGGNLPGLTRPDKIVAYCGSFEEVEQVGRSIAESVGEVGVQGVPFTADLAGDGLLSWGMDPHEKPVLEWQEAASWRLWITNHLARSLLIARASAGAGIEPWRFALDRLRLEGVDTDTWTPTTAYEQRVGRR